MENYFDGQATRSEKDRISDIRKAGLNEAKLESKNLVI